MMILHVTPSLDSEGRMVSSSRGQLFNGSVAGRMLVQRSRQPLLDAARVLLAEGVNPWVHLAMHHAGSSVAALAATVGAVARLSVREGKRPPQFEPWKPSPHAAGTPGIAPEQSPATPIATAEKLTLR
jgi:hypothetical protein